MNLFVKTSYAKTISLDIQGEETLLDIKKRLAASEKRNLSSMRIFVNGKECEDS